MNGRYFSDIPIKLLHMEIYDILGHFIKSFNIEYSENGWNNFSFPINEISSGTYICRLSGNEYLQSAKFHLIK